MPRLAQSSVCPAVARPRSPVDILNWNRQVLRLPELSSGEKCAAIALGGYINGRSGFAWPGLATVAEDCGVSIQTARRALHKLERLGLLHVEHRSGTSNRYHLTAGVEVFTPISTEVSTPISTEVSTPTTGDRAPLPPAIPDQAIERAIPPNPPEGGHVDKSTGKTPAPAPARTAVYPRVRRTRRAPEPAVYAGCHRPADPAYLSPPPPRTDRGAAAAAVGALLAALGRSSCTDPEQMVDFG